MNAKIIIGLAIGLLAPLFAHAQPLGSSAPDTGAGKKRAAACFSCHNVDGIAKIPGVPHLAGQERSYLESALRAYRSAQTRQNATMNAMAKPLSDNDIANIAAYFSLQTRMNQGQTVTQALETAERIRPVGQVQVAAAMAMRAPGAAPSTVRSGDAVYGETCMACHASGVAGAPKAGDTAAWASRLAQGSGVLIQHALQGYKGMPPKGGCANCSDAEIKSAVEYLLAKGK